jgi:hypothetical protein
MMEGQGFAEGDKLQTQAQRRGNPPLGPEENQPNNPGGQLPDGQGLTDPMDPAGADLQGQQPGGEQPQDQSPEGQNPPPGQDPGSGSGDGGPGTSPIRSPADLMLPRKIDQQVEPSPLRPEHLAVLLDRTTTRKPEEKRIEGLINVNTAPRHVLECIDGLAAEQIEALMAARTRLDDRDLETPAWLIAEGILDLETFAKIAPAVTARAQQFSIESLGYADHKGMVTRLQVVIDMIGPIAQTVYTRDISYLGASYPIREEHLEQQRAR